jgi:NADPH:quinone reductase-like Zn-dependent oxidoreductase
VLSLIPPLPKAITLGAEAGINYKTEDFAARVSELTEGRGANIILDCVGGSYAPQNIEALAVDGRYHRLKYTVVKICETYIMLMAGITD